RRQRLPGQGERPGRGRVLRVRPGDRRDGRGEQDQGGRNHVEGGPRRRAGERRRHQVGAGEEGGLSSRVTTKPTDDRRWAFFIPPARSLQTSTPCTARSSGPGRRRGSGPASTPRAPWWW